MAANYRKKQWARRDSNPWHPACEAGNLLLLAPWHPSCSLAFQQYGESALRLKGKSPHEGSRRPRQLESSCPGPPPIPHQAREPESSGIARLHSLPLLSIPSQPMASRLTAALQRCCWLSRLLSGLRRTRKPLRPASTRSAMFDHYWDAIATCWEGQCIDTRQGHDGVARFPWSQDRC